MVVAEAPGKVAVTMVDLGDKDHRTPGQIPQIWKI
jgi:hypothetical protein